MFRDAFVVRVVFSPHRKHARPVPWSNDVSFVVVFGPFSHRTVRPPALGQTTHTCIPWNSEKSGFRPMFVGPRPRSARAVCGNYPTGRASVAVMVVYRVVITPASVKRQGMDTIRAPYHVPHSGGDGRRWLAVKRSGSTILVQKLCVARKKCTSIRHQRISTTYSKHVHSNRFVQTHLDELSRATTINLTCLEQLLFSLTSYLYFIRRYVQSRWSCKFKKIVKKISHTNSKTCNYLKNL